MNQIHIDETGSQYVHSRRNRIIYFSHLYALLPFHHVSDASIKRWWAGNQNSLSDIEKSGI